MQSPKFEPRRLDWPTVILLIFLSQVASGRLAITMWTEFLFIGQTLATLGVTLGLALGYSQFKRKAVLWLAWGYSIVVIPWQMTIVINEDVQLAERLASVGGRLLFSLRQFFEREPVEDGLLFVAFISTLLWFLFLLSGYWWTRHENYLVAILPGGIFTLTIHLYDKLIVSRIWLLGVYVLFALLLLGRSYYLKNREAWRARRVFQMQESAFDLTRGMTIAAFLFVFVAWTVPASRAGVDSFVRTWNRVTKPWREMQEWLSNAVESLDAPSPPKVGDFYKSVLSLGTGNPLSDSVVFTVDIPDLLEEQPRFYWRGYTYDVYQNSKWSLSNTNTEEFIPSDDSIVIPDAGRRSAIRFTFITQIQQTLLYVPAQPVWVSRPGTIKVVITDDGEQDLFAWLADPRLSPGEQYQARASVTDPFTQELQEAGTAYPEWVTDKYLQLPEGFSPRIRELAGEITRDLETPYDKATAVTNYLRNEIEYTNPLPEPLPEGVDPLEWVLFDLKQGFCNYYASAEVLMLRSLGIPARMAVGFAEGEFDTETFRFTVRSRDAHAWPEVFFPGIGWVEFEPTANQSPLVRYDRPEEEINPLLLGPGDLADPESSAQRPRPEERETEEIGVIPSPLENKTISSLLYFVLTASLIVLLWFMNHRYAVIEQIPYRLQAAYERSGGQPPTWINRWAHWNALSSIERSFEAINRSLRLLGEPPSLHHTPMERATALKQKLPQAASAIETLTEQHQASLFTTHPGNPEHAKRASLSIWLYTIQEIIRDFIEDLERRFSRPGQF